MRTFALAFENIPNVDALVAQLVEHLTLNQRVQGSNPCRRTKRHFLKVSLFVFNTVTVCLRQFYFVLSYFYLTFAKRQNINNKLWKKY